MVSRAIWKKHAPVNFKCYRKAQVRRTSPICTRKHACYYKIINNRKIEKLNRIRSPPNGLKTCWKLFVSLFENISLIYSLH
jgi:hypothetical protein